MADAEALQSKETVHILSEISSYKRVPFFRSTDFFEDIIIRLSHSPISTEFQAYINILFPILTAYNEMLVGRTAHLGKVTLDCTKFNEVYGGFPKFLDGLEAPVRIALNGDEAALKYLYFTDRAAFNAGSEGMKMMIIQNWLRRFDDYSVLTAQKVEATLWYTHANSLLVIKDTSKDNVTDDRLTLKGLKAMLFDAAKQIFGGLLSKHSNELDVLIRCFNVNLLKARQKDTSKALVNQVDLTINAGETVNSFKIAITPTNIIHIDNSKNAFPCKVWISPEIDTLMPGYAFEVPEFTSVETKVGNIGPRGAQVVMACFANITASGVIRVTIKSNK